MTGPPPDVPASKAFGDENFHVVQLLVAPRDRAVIAALYRFARIGDDIADDPGLAPADKLARIAAMRAGLDGDGAPEAMALAAVMAEHGIDPVHAHDLLDAFVQDVAVRRYAGWDDLLGYCRLSAAPVGRFFLDLRGEDRALRPRADALCTALQIVNHLQDCGDDARTMDRVYLPTELIERHGATVADLWAPAATPPLRAAIADAAARTTAMLRTSASLAGAIRSRRLALEVAVIQRFAEDLARRLEREDPLTHRVAHRRPAAARLTLIAIATHLAGKLAGRTR